MDAPLVRVRFELPRLARDSCQGRDQQIIPTAVQFDLFVAFLFVHFYKPRWLSSREAAYRDHELTKSFLLHGGFDTAEEHGSTQPPISHLLQLHRHRHRFAAAETQRSDAAFQAAVLQGIDQGRQYARAACAKRMSQCDRAAVDVDLVPVPALVGEGVTIRQHLRGKGFVEFDQINIL